MKKVLLPLVASCLLFVQPALAQEGVSVQQRGEDSITLAVDFDSAGIGYWHKLSPANDVGVDFTSFMG